WFSSWGRPRDYSFLLFFFFEVPDLAGRFDSDDGGWSEARDGILCPSLSRSAPSGASRGSSAGAVASSASARARIVGPSSRSLPEAAGPIPGHASEHKGKFGISRRIASRTNASSTTVSPS